MPWSPGMSRNTMETSRILSQEKGEKSHHSPLDRSSLVAQLVKNLPAKRETWVQSLGWEDPLKKGKVTHFKILAWRISWTV